MQKFPFRIHTIRTDRGHEWQAKFHWHVEDQGILHTYIKPRSPHSMGKLSVHIGTDHEEFYQLLTYKDDVDLDGKLAAWKCSIIFIDHTALIMARHHMRL